MKGNHDRHHFTEAQARGHIPLLGESIGRVGIFSLLLFYSSTGLGWQKMFCNLIKKDSDLESTICSRAKFFAPLYSLLFEKHFNPI